MSKRLLNICLVLMVLLGLSTLAWAVTENIIATPSSMKADGVNKLVSMYPAGTSATEGGYTGATYWVTHNYKTARFVVYNLATGYTGGICYFHVLVSPNKTNWQNIWDTTWSSTATSAMFVTGLTNSTGLQKYIRVDVMETAPTQPCKFGLYGYFQQ